MKKVFLLLCIGAIAIACIPKKTVKDPKPAFIDLTSLDGEGQQLMPTYMKTITEAELKDMLYVYASDAMEGRNTGEPGQKKAADYIRQFYKDNNIAGGMADGSYYQIVPDTFYRKGSNLKSSENVLAYIRGSKKPEEVIVISAHLDHVGMDKNGNVYNGADDDGSGTVAVMQIAQAFKMAAEKGHGPKRSLLFLHVTAEEKGLYGSKFYVEYPVYPLANTVTNLNIDMIGRRDYNHTDATDDYIYLIGSDKLSTELHNLSAAINKKYFDLNVDYRYNRENDPNRFYYRSDHYNFAKKNIPVIFYFNGVHDDYHKITDTPDKIDYPLLTKRAQLVFATAWEVANRPERVIVDKLK